MSGSAARRGLLGEAPLRIPAQSTEGEGTSARRSVVRFGTFVRAFGSLGSFLGLLLSLLRTANAQGEASLPDNLVQRSLVDEVAFRGSRTVYERGLVVPSRRRRISSLTLSIVLRVWTLVVGDLDPPRVATL